jgi:nucleoid-associated protein YgaU
MFDGDGRPVRARLTCTFNEVIDPIQEAREVNRQTADFTKLHVVTQGQRLIDVATTYYKDPQAWRPIAIANGINDPRTIFPGQALIVPSLPFIDPQTREVVN